MLTGSFVAAYAPKSELSTASKRVSEYLSDLSFPLYVIHWPIAYMTMFASTNWPLQVVLPITPLASMACLHVVDRPLRHLGGEKVSNSDGATAELAAAPEVLRGNGNR